MQKITFPLILVNFKTYIEGTGKKGLELSKTCERVMKKTDICIAAAVQAIDLRMIAKEVNIPIFIQHIDPITPGSNTGHILIDAAKEAGVIGTLVNHSEKRLKIGEIDEILQLSRTKGIFTCACANTARIAGAIASLSPDCCATEPPELIGSGVSVSSAKPEAIKETVDIIKKINPKVVPLCGAGIINAADVKKAMLLGTRGILIASGIVKATNPEKTLEEMALTMKDFEEK